MRWFSASLRKVCFIEGKKATLAMDIVRIFQARDFDHAFERALELGRASEEEYRNADGLLVRWRLQEVLSLDVIQSNHLDGAEVYSSFVELTEEEQVVSEVDLRPEDSEPNQTL